MLHGADGIVLMNGFELIIGKVAEIRLTDYRLQNHYVCRRVLSYLLVLMFLIAMYYN